MDTHKQGNHRGGCPVYVYFIWFESRTLLGCLLFAPVELCHALVASIALLCHALGCLKQLVCLGRELLCKCCIAHLALQELLELLQLRLLAVKGEWVLALVLKCWVVTPQVPVTALNGSLLLGLSLAHTALDTVVDTWSVCNYQ